MLKLDMTDFTLLFPSCLCSPTKYVSITWENFLGCCCWRWRARSLTCFLRNLWPQRRQKECLSGGGVDSPGGRRRLLGAGLGGGLPNMMLQTYCGWWWTRCWGPRPGWKRRKSFENTYKKTFWVYKNISYRFLTNIQIGWSLEQNHDHFYNYLEQFTI